MKVWNEIKGWGEIIAVDGAEVLVRWDADPWFPTWEKGDDDPPSPPKKF